MQELDAPTLATRNEHPMIQEPLHNLADGETLHLINDHDRRPLRFEIEADDLAAFQRECLERGPEVWRVDIRKVGAPSEPVVLTPEARVALGR